MAIITGKGRALARSLEPEGFTLQNGKSLEELCSLIARHATTHHRLMEAEGNGCPVWETNPRIDVELGNKIQERFEKWLEKRVWNIETRIRTLCHEEIDSRIVPIFGGDPRGCTVILQVPSGRTDDWGKRGICVPQEHR